VLKIQTMQEYVFVWVHGYLGSKSTFGTLPRDLADSFSGVKNHFILYEFDQSFDSVADRIHMELLSLTTASSTAKLIVFTHSMGGLLLAQAFAHNADAVATAVEAVCFFDVPFGGVKPSYLARLVDSSSSEAVSQILPDLGFDVKGLQAMLQSLNDFEEKNRLAPKTEKELAHEHAVTKAVQFLTQGPLQDLMEPFGDILRPLLDEHSVFLLPLFQQKRLEQLQRTIKDLFQKGGLTCLHVYVQPEQDQDACFRYIKVANSSTSSTSSDSKSNASGNSWTNCAVELKGQVNLFSPLTAHATLFTHAHSMQMFDECYCFVSDTLKLAQRSRRPWYKRLPSLVFGHSSEVHNNSNTHLWLVGLCVVLLLAHRVFSPMLV
jgi:pimeloyl-ACP methyl ester carboxylesterase